MKGRKKYTKNIKLCITLHVLQKLQKKKYNGYLVAMFNWKSLKYQLIMVSANNLIILK